MEHQRRFDLDWLRVGAFSLLILFHTGMMFNSWEWHVKNPQTSEVFDYVMIFLSQWRMPLLFFISGAAVWHALGKYSSIRFMKERIQRLLIPLLFGMLVIVPPQIYFERLFQGQSFDSYFHFYRSVLQFQPYPYGNFSWHHLWYLPYILTYSLFLLPFFRFLKSEIGTRVVSRIIAFLKRPGYLLLGSVPIALSEIALRPFWPSNSNSLVGDWAQVSTTSIIFCYGFLLASSPAIWTVIENYRRRALAFALLSLFTLYLLWIPDYDLSRTQYPFYRFLRSFNVWIWLLAIAGFARKYLNRNHPFLKYATDAVYPFYMVHQTITVAVGYHLIRWQAGIGLKFMLLAAATVFGSWSVYEVLRRFNITRVLFGMKARRKHTSIQELKPVALRA